MQDVVQEPDTRRWRAVLDRDPASDGEFFYGVTSTRDLLPAHLPITASPSVQSQLLRNG